MSRGTSRKLNVETAIVAFDTSIVFAADNQHIVCSDFENFLAEAKDKSKLDLFVPEVVVKELARQNFEECEAKIKAIGAGLNAIYRNTGKRYKCPAKLDTVGEAGDRKIRRWFKDNRIKILNTPYSKISIAEIERYAVNHVPPFEGRSDKGIKDYLILKTLGCFREAKQAQKFVFLCSDKRLAEAFEDSLRYLGNTHTYQSINEYQNLIKLKYENYSDTFIAKVNKVAASKFYDFQAKTGLYHDFKIWSKIAQEYSDLLDRPTSSPNEKDSQAYQPIEEPKLYLDKPRYLGKEGKTYKFSSKLTRKRKFRSESGLMETEWEVNFAILWSAKISKDGRFLATDFEKIEIESMEARPIYGSLLGTVGQSTVPLSGSFSMDNIVFA